MLTSLPRLLLLGVLFLVVAAGLLWMSGGRDPVPESCREGSRALEAQDYNAAIDSFLACIDTGELEDDLLADVYYALGGASFAKGKYFQAVQDYSAAIEINPEHAWAYNNRCWTYGLMRRPEDALEDCNEALRRLPNQPEVLDSRALAYWQLGEIEKAKEDLARARQRSTSLPLPEDRIKEFEAMF